MQKVVAARTENLVSHTHTHRENNYYTLAANAYVPLPFTGGGRVWGHSRLFCDIALECKRHNQIAPCTCCHRNIWTVR